MTASHFRPYTTNCELGCQPDKQAWNNNNAEHAIKAFAGLREVIDGPSTESGIRDYLVLLSICQTCEYRGIDFLKFLRSGEKRIGNYVSKGRRLTVCPFALYPLRLDSWPKRANTCWG